MSKGVRIPAFIAVWGIIPGPCGNVLSEMTARGLPAWGHLPRVGLVTQECSPWERAYVGMLVTVGTVKAFCGSRHPHQLGKRGEEWHPDREAGFRGKTPGLQQDLRTG